MERYEEWDVSIPPLPPRSRLYRLEPIGIGTPYVESLTGYIARLAETHHVTPKDLVMLEIMPPQPQTGPILNYYNRLCTFWSKNALTLNGVSPLARQWVGRLESLTTCNNLTFLTMLTFHEVIAMNRLLRQSKAWCGQCYEERRRAYQVVYDHLLWSLNGIDICLRHRQPLVTRCPSCQKTLPFLTQTTRPGYCPHCTHWLGSSKGSLDMLGQSAESEVSTYQHWVAEVSGNLLAAAPSLAVLPSKKQLAIRVKAFLDQYAAGNMRKLARLSGVGFYAIWHYLHQESVPYFDSFLKMCFALSITPLEFLSTSTIPSLKDVGFHIESVPTLSRGQRKHLTEDDVQRMRKVLEAVLAVDDQVDPFPSLNDVAKRMGFAASTLRKHCPDLSKAIAWHSKNHWVVESHLGVMKQALEDALANSEPESLANVACKLRCSTSSMWKYFPDLCRAIVTRYRERFDDARIEQQLREVLASNAEAPAVQELARSMGYERHILWDRFPDLCKQISRRRYAERRRRREERIALLCKEIRQVVYLLHSQGMYPGARKVSQELGDSHALLAKEGRDAWCQALEALGYPTLHLKKVT